MRGPYIYSMNDLGTRFKILRYPHPSAAYLESFYYSDNLCASQYPQWESAGKMLVPTIVEAETFPLQVNLRDRMYFQVEYDYERLRERSFGVGDVPLATIPGRDRGRSKKRSTSWNTPRIKPINPQTVAT